MHNLQVGQRFVKDWYYKSSVGCVLRTIDIMAAASAAASPAGPIYSLYRRMMMIPKTRQTTP